MKHMVKWAAAIGLSLLAHAGGAMFLAPENEKEEVLVAGGSSVEVSLLGNAFEDTVQAGDPSDVVEPTEETPEELTPTEAEATEEVDAAVIASVAPVETVIPEEKPELPKVVQPEVEKPEPKKEPVKKKKVARKKAGDGGKQAKTQNKGKSDGVENARAAAASGEKRGGSQEIGNAAVSNYPGKVRRKLTRAIRYPSAAKRQGLRGVAHVSFTVTSGGGVASVGITKSAGSPVLDQAALETVRRAAPFPAIPAGAGRDRWEFNIPVAFTR
ncbi:energy transducer TonB [Sinorhizobium medicae]|nr:energy transducer TonB [Sinorhizobium medicae]